MELGWRKTWDDSDDDFVYCDDAGRSLGRVYYGHMRHWLWFFAGSSGYTVSRREALLAVELAYEGRPASSTATLA
jgi:hypothetical protein